jgi:hypothetical protein
VRGIGTPVKTPCIIITRDRVSYTRLCVASLERFGDQFDIHIVDHGSTYGPMLDYLAESPHPVHWRNNVVPRSLWTWDGLQKIVGGLGSRRYLVTDPDIVIDPDCPADWLCRMSDELNQGAIKVGLGLRLDDLPDTPLAAKVRAWEGQYWQTPASAGAWWAPVDTTIALHQGLGVAPDFALGPAVRMREPYLARHLPWYGSLDADETIYYRDHAARCFALGQRYLKCPVIAKLGHLV